MDLTPCSLKHGCPHHTPLALDYVLARGEVLHTPPRRSTDPKDTLFRIRVICQRAMPHGRPSTLPAPPNTTNPNPHRQAELDDAALVPTPDAEQLISAVDTPATWTRQGHPAKASGL